MPRPALILAGVFAVTVIVGVFILPRHESSLGVNSSLRQVCDHLRSEHAVFVEADQYWPGMEFYLGDNAVRYAVNDKHQQERSSDGGVPPLRFIDPEHWPVSDSLPPGAKDFWLVRFLKRKDSPFDSILDDASAGPRIGQFRLFHVYVQPDGKRLVRPNSPLR